MSFVVITDAASGIGIDSAVLHGHWTGAAEVDPAPSYQVDVKFLWGYGSPSTEVGDDIYYTEDGSYSYNLSGLSADKLVSFSFRGRDIRPGGFSGGSNVDFKTLATAMIFGTPAATDITGNSANINVTFNPRTGDSVAEIKGQYRVKAGPGSWVDTVTIGGQTGDYNRNIQFALTGLTQNTTYEFKFVATRNTINATSAETAPLVEFTTLTATLTLAINETMTWTETQSLPSPSDFLAITETLTFSETTGFVIGEQAIHIMVKTVDFGVSYVR